LGEIGYFGNLLGACFEFKEVVMLSRQMQFADEQESLFVEQAQAMYREMRERAHNAPDGQVLAVAEATAITRGRDLVRKGLERVVQTEIVGSEKKGRRRGRVRVAAPATTVVREAAKCSPPRARSR
jgi:hypothetical protein